MFNCLYLLINKALHIYKKAIFSRGMDSTNHVEIISARPDEQLNPQDF